MAPESATQPPPVEFLTPGWEPDVCLRLFDQEFYVHSAALKLKTVFFRKCLDSPEKAATSGTGRFKYEWITKIDADDTCQLVCAANPPVWQYRPHAIAYVAELTTTRLRKLWMRSMEI